MSAPLDLLWRGVSRRFAGAWALDDVTLRAPAGGTLAVLGPSGSGKSTLLRLAAGLEAPDAGRIFLGGTDVTTLPPERRHVGLVFQDYALFPHLNVLGNVIYGLREAGVPRREAERIARATLDLVGLTGLEKRRVTELSGGERQRVALARSIAPRPGVLLLDEPLSNLDEVLRGELRGELAQLFARLGVTVTLVTHDRREALALSNHLAVLRGGRLVQSGPTAEVFREPVDAWTARFLGRENVLTSLQAAALGLVPSSPGLAFLLPVGAVVVAPRVQLAGCPRLTGRLKPRLTFTEDPRRQVEVNGVTLTATLDGPVALDGAVEAVQVSLNSRLGRWFPEGAL